MSEREERQRAPKGSVGHRVLLRVPPGLWREVERAAKREGVPASELCRRALAAFIALNRTS